MNLSKLKESLTCDVKMNRVMGDKRILVFSQLGQGGRDMKKNWKVPEVCILDMQETFGDVVPGDMQDDFNWETYEWSGDPES